MNRRSFIAGLTATAAGLLIPERKVWALDRTHLQPLTVFDDYPVIGDYPGMWGQQDGYNVGMWSYPSIETMEVDAGVVGYTKVWAPLDQRDQWTTTDAPHFVVSGDYVYGFQGNSVYRWNGVVWDKQ